MTKQCDCHACIKKHGLMGPSGHFPLSTERMIVCHECGNKRCPKASNHELECTGSNWPGQPGSIYQ